MKLLVSACLLGEPCRYDGRGFDPAPLARLTGRCEMVPVCPERLGGLKTPRSPCECREALVWNRDGEDVTATFAKGAASALALAEREGCRCALLKEQSPSCGSNRIYDGSFTGKKIPGEGRCAALLRQNGIAVFSEEEIDPLLRWLAAKSPPVWDVPMGG